MFVFSGLLLYYFISIPFCYADYVHSGKLSVTIWCLPVCFTDVFGWKRSHIRPSCALRSM